MQGEAPDWVRDGMRQLVGEVRLFLRTAIDFTAHPVRFAGEWSTGQRHALNPLGFLATAFAVAGPANAVFAHLVRSDEKSASLLRDALAALNPFAYYLALGALQHGVLRLFGSQRPLRDSCAMALYAGGGPALLVHLVVMVAMYLVWRVSGTLNFAELHTGWVVALTIGLGVSFTLFVTTLSAALGGLHGPDGIRSYHIAIANTVAFVITGFAFAVLQPAGSFGLHFVLGPSHEADGWHFHWGLGD